MYTHLSRMFAATCLTAMLLPSLAVASSADTDPTLQDLVKIIQYNKLPMSFSTEVKGNYDGYAASLLLTGTHNGKTSSLLRTAADIAGTLQLDRNDEHATAAFDIRIVDALLFVRLRELTISGEELSEWRSSIDPYLNQWISFPLEDNSAFHRARRQAELNRLNQANQWAKFLGVQNVLKGNEVTSTVSLPQAKKRKLLAILARSSKGKARQAVLRSIVDVNAVVVSKARVLSSAELTMKLSTLLEGKTLSLSITTDTKALSSEAAIKAPTGAKGLEEVLQEAQEQ